MKPTRDGEDVARDMTSENLPSPIPSPERDKVEEIQNRLLRVAMLGYVPPDDLHVIAEVAVLLSSSETWAKQLGEATGAIETLEKQVATAERERDEARANSEAVLDQWRGEITKSEKRAEELKEDLWRVAIERDDARASFGYAESERDSLRSSLARVVEALTLTDDKLSRLITDLEHFVKAAHIEILVKWQDQVRSALHRSQGE